MLVKGGELMIIKDNERTYDTELLTQFADGDQDVMPQSIYNKAFNLIYRRYVYIRNVIASERCQQPMLNQLVAELTQDNLNRITKTLGYSINEIWFYVNFTKDYISAVR